MIEFINEPVNVEVRLREDGTALPLAFVWHERRLQIKSWGREKVKTQEGNTLHYYLVQTSETETWELCHDTEKAQWLLARRWANRYKIV